jgi:membrane associated rhomboid family serine protease
MESFWPRYSLYSAEEIKRGLARSQFLFLTLVIAMLIGMLAAFVSGSIPVAVACALGAIQNLFAWIFVSKKHSRVAAAILVGTNVLIAGLHIAFLQPDSAISIALTIYCINMLRACVALRNIK